MNTSARKGARLSNFGHFVTSYLRGFYWQIQVS
jgi:hypothetical protein